MIALLIVLAALADVLTFICAVSVLPISGELNPLARWLYVNTGLLGIIALKWVATLLVVGLIGFLDGRRRAVGVYVAVLVPLLAAGANTLAVAVSR